MRSCAPSVSKPVSKTRSGSSLSFFYRWALGQTCESVVLRPVNSMDGMTADVVLMEPAMLDELTARLLALKRSGGRILRPHQQAARHHRMGVMSATLLFPWKSSIVSTMA